ncbi:camp-dependent protein kinase activity/conidium formation [Cryphonectria parasitica EP155]|uniref:cAMP-dependent protein kinase regulatory subunit n=1 Tax=Cryphonectria parasitica (strain ATCC 38755 / EP155) TaxID=660469 RepID=A0A9P5CJU8_CRYP1|nr:camp-dependent protein kinase activity/conidium formation [Cryphonectria parasitica EP155]KAF3760502.1 camp-dependent protein kinase activity/conidium formation [Cryphonectria parasitica EP155]
MSSSSFTSPFGVNSNPFGSNDGGMMQKVIEEEEGDLITSPTTGSFNSMRTTSFFTGPFGGFDGGHEPPTGLRSPPNTDNFPAQYNFGRRTSVSAESLKPTAEHNDNWQPPVFPKSREQLERLTSSISENFLFKHMDDEQRTQVLSAMQEKPIPAKGIKVITQGDAGDYFYVVEKGSFQVYVNQAGSMRPGADGMGSQVGTIEAGGSFGELALMYNAPRAATVVSAEAHCVLWALDRLTFRRILMESTFQRRRMYENFLEEVPLLKSLTSYERSKIADALETQKYPTGTVIIREGDPGYDFFLLESGECDAYKEGLHKERINLRHYTKGDFFGELALLNDAPRAATVISSTEVKVAKLGKNAFQRLLGPVESIMRRTKYEDVKSGVEDVDPLASA